MSPVRVRKNFTHSQYVVFTPVYKARVIDLNFVAQYMRMHQNVTFPRKKHPTFAPRPYPFWLLGHVPVIKS